MTANNFRKESPPTSGCRLGHDRYYERHRELIPSSLCSKRIEHQKSAHSKSCRPDRRQQTTSPRPRVLPPGSIAPEFAHLIHNNLPSSSSFVTHARTNDDSSVRPPSCPHWRDYSGSSSCRSTAFMPVNNPYLTSIDGHPREKIRPGTPYPSEHDLKPKVKERERTQGSQSLDDEIVSGAEQIAEVLKNVQLDGKPRLISIGGATRSSRQTTSGARRTSDAVITTSSAHEQRKHNTAQFGLHEVNRPDDPERLPGYSTPVVPGAWPATPPPLERPSKTFTVPATSQDRTHEDQRLPFFLNEEANECLRGLRVDHLVHDDYRRDSEIIVTQVNQDEDFRKSCTPRNTGKNSSSPFMNTNQNRVSVDEEFARNYYTNTLKTVQEGEQRAHLTESYQNQDQCHVQHGINSRVISYNPWAENNPNSSGVGTSAIRQNVFVTNRSIEGGVENIERNHCTAHARGCNAAWMKFLETNADIEITVSPRTSSSIPATQDVPDLTAANNTPSSASLSTIDFLDPSTESENSSSQDFSGNCISSSIEPLQETLDAQPSLPSSSQEVRNAPLPPLTLRPTPPVPTIPPPYHHSNYSVPYTISTPASISIPATSNPPSPRVGVFNTSDAILRTASGRTYLMPERQTPVDLTPLLQESQEVEEIAVSRTTESAAAATQVDKNLKTEDHMEQAPRKSPCNPYRLTEAQEELRIALIQRHFRRNQSQSSDTHSSTPERNDTAKPNQQNPHPPARPLPRSRYYRKFSSQAPASTNTHSHSPSTVSETTVQPYSTPTPDQHFGYPLHSFSRPYDTSNPHYLVRTSPSSEWVDTDTSTIDSRHPIPAALVTPAIQEEQPTHEMQELRTPSSNALKRYLLSLYQNVRTIQGTVQQKWTASKHKPHAFLRRVRGARFPRSRFPLALIKKKHHAAMSRLTRHFSGASDHASSTGSAVRAQRQRRGGVRKGVWRRYLRIPSGLRKVNGNSKAVRKFVKRILAKMAKLRKRVEVIEGKERF